MSFYLTDFFWKSYSHGKSFVHTFNPIRKEEFFHPFLHNSQ
ncbi:hypothetical protein HMPREF1548_03547 [Clostridium sp. KLE 1755]|nr:hypothetical protein HMPREF1548_03547 [Clostridium sp. KLE 1755]